MLLWDEIYGIVYTHFVLVYATGIQVAKSTVSQLLEAIILCDFGPVICLFVGRVDGTLDLQRGT
jgi:hypothetical protein